MQMISPSQTDFLKEMGITGAEKAAMSLSGLLQKKVTVTNSKICGISLENVCNFLGDPEQIVCALTLKISGDLEGYMLLFFSNNHAVKLLNTWFEETPPISEPLSEFYESALKELSNIATGGYLNALSKLTGYTFFCSPPDLAKDMLGALLNEILCEIAIDEDSIILIDTQFEIEREIINGYFLLLVAPNSMEKIFARNQLS